MKGHNDISQSTSLPAHRAGLHILPRWGVSIYSLQSQRIALGFRILPLQGNASAMPVIKFDFPKERKLGNDFLSSLLGGVKSCALLCVFCGIRLISSFMSTLRKEEL